MKNPIRKHAGEPPAGSETMHWTMESAERAAEKNRLARLKKVIPAKPPWRLVLERAAQTYLGRKGFQKRGLLPYENPTREPPA